MNLIIFGASGRTGQHLVEQALQQGHTVTAFARTPGKISMAHERLRIVQGNIHDADKVEQAVEGHDVVLCSLGMNHGEPETALAAGTRNIVQAMKKHGIQRIICVSAVGFLGEKAGFLVGKVTLWFFGRYLRKLFGAMKRQYQELEDSGLEWIAVRPFLLDEGPRKGNYRVAMDGVLSKGFRINTGDAADFMLKQLKGNEYVGKAPAIAY
jgi:putative NADH-flavin reductase